MAISTSCSTTTPRMNGEELQGKKHSTTSWHDANIGVTANSKLLLLERNFSPRSLCHVREEEIKIPAITYTHIHMRSEKSDRKVGVCSSYRTALWLRGCFDSNREEQRHQYMSDESLPNMRFLGFCLKRVSFEYWVEIVRLTVSVTQVFSTGNGEKGSDRVISYNRVNNFAKVRMD